MTIALAVDEYDHLSATLGSAAGFILLSGEERTRLVPAEKIPGVHLVLHVVQAGIIAVCNNRRALLFEFAQIIDHFAAEESGTVFQGGLVNDYGGTFGLDPFHDALDGTLAEIV